MRSGSPVDKCFDGSMLPLGIDLISLGIAYFEPTWFRSGYASKYGSIFLLESEIHR